MLNEEGYVFDPATFTTIKFIAFKNTPNKGENKMEDNELLAMKEEALKEIQEAIEDAFTLIVRLTKIKNDVKNIATQADYEKVINDNFDIEDELKHIRLF